MTVNEIIKNENIRSDRYAMAAISFIFKAFGDNIRSKEYWPWGKDVQCEWSPSKGTKYDITLAEQLLERSKNKYLDEIGEFNLINDKYVSMFKIKSVSDNTSILNLPSYKIKLNTLYYYEKNNDSNIYELKVNDYLYLSIDNYYTIYKIIEIDNKTYEIIVDRVFGDYELNSNSTYEKDKNMYFQIYIMNREKTSGGSNNDFNTQLKDLKRRLNKVNINIKRINKTSKEASNISEKANNIIDSI